MKRLRPREDSLDDAAAWMEDDDNPVVQHARREWQLDRDYSEKLQSGLRLLMVRHDFTPTLLHGELVLFDRNMVPWRKAEIRETSPVAAAFDVLVKVLDLDGGRQPFQTECSCGLVSACDEDGCCLSCGEDLFNDEDGNPRDTAAGRLLAEKQEVFARVACSNALIEIRGIVEEPEDAEQAWRDVKAVVARAIIGPDRDGGRTT